MAFQRGAVLRDRTEVKGIVKDEERGGIRVLIGDGDGGGEIRAEKCVITVGAWTEKLVRKVSGIELPIQVVETTVCYWRVREGYEGKFSIEGEFRFPTFASYGELHLYGTPSMEYHGLMKIAVHDGYPCDPDKRVWGPGKSVEELKEWIEKRFGGMVVGLGGPEAKQSCMYSMTPDEDYVIDFVGEEFGKDVVVGGGFSADKRKTEAELREHIVREKWIDIERSKILRERLRWCYRVEGVNHLQKCRHLVQQYLDSTRGIGWGKDHRPPCLHGPKVDAEAAEAE
ncbi:Probable sarcosine oxidase [Linum perenne]